MKTKNTEKRVRNEKILKLYNQGFKTKEIIDSLEVLGFGKLTEAVICNVTQNHRDEVTQLNYTDRKIASTEKSLQRQRNESNYLRKVNRESFKETIKNEDILELVEQLVQSNFKPLPLVKPKRTTGKYKIFQYSDIHIGKKGTFKLQKGEKLTIKQRLDILFDDIISCEEKEIYLINTGDMFENLIQNSMHSGQHLSQDILFANEAIEYGFNLLSGLYDRVLKEGKIITSIFIGGNHDRFSQKNEDDLLRMGMYTLVSMLRQRYLNNKHMTFVYDPKEERLHYEVKDAYILMSHGENGFNKVNVENFRTKFDINTSKHLLVLSGHRHQLKIENGYRTTKIICPSIAGIGDYDHRLGYSSNNGYIVITIENGLPSIQVKYTD